MLLPVSFRFQWFLLLVLWGLGGIASSLAASKEPPPTPSPLEEAWALLYQGELTLALKRFVAIEKELPKEAPHRFEALYGQAHSRISLNRASERERARELYKTILAESPPTSPLRPWCELELAQIAHYFTPMEERDHAAIVKTYLDVYRDHPGSLAGQEAFLSGWMLQKAALNEPPQSIIDHCLAFLQAHPKTPFRAQTLGLIAQSYRDQGKIQEALAYQIQALEERIATNPMFDASTHIWLIAYAAEFELGDLSLARDYYEKLIERYPRDTRIFSARQALARIEELIDAARKGEPLPAQPTGGKNG